jgi:hypothetical protein
LEEPQGVLWLEIYETFVVLEELPLPVDALVLDQVLLMNITDVPYDIEPMKQ